MKQARPYPQVIVTRKAARSLKAGHLWVYAGEVLGFANLPDGSEAPENGSVVDVMEENGTWQGAGLLSQESTIRVRLLTRNANDRVDRVGPSGIRELVERSKASLRAVEKSGLPAMVGKWSGSLPFADTITTPEGRIALERIYISEQLATFKPCAAWFFQTWKTEGRLAGWDARVSLSSFERRMLA